MSFPIGSRIVTTGKLYLHSTPIDSRGGAPTVGPLLPVGTILIVVGSLTGPRRIDLPVKTKVQGRTLSGYLTNPGSFARLAPSYGANPHAFSRSFSTRTAGDEFESFPSDVNEGHSWGPFHAARGGLPSTEHGFDIQIRTQRRGDCVFALAMVGTPWGPLQLMARADLKVIQGILGLSGDALAKLSTRMATEGVLRKVADISCPTKKNAAAENLYKRLVARDPTAKQSARTLRDLARMGDRAALEGWQCLRGAHARAAAIQTSPAMPAPSPTASSGWHSSNVNRTYDPLAGYGVHSGNPSAAGCGVGNLGDWAAAYYQPLKNFEPVSGEPYAYIAGTNAVPSAPAPYRAPRRQGLAQAGLSTLIALSGC